MDKFNDYRMEYDNYSSETHAKNRMKEVVSCFLITIMMLLFISLLAFLGLRIDEL